MIIDQIERLASSSGSCCPDVPTPVANFVPFRRHGELVYLAGQICEWNGDVRFVGKVGVDYDLAEAQAGGAHLRAQSARRAAQACGGSLDRVAGCLRVGGFVNCTPDYPDVPQVINGASDLIHELFGERGRHARTAVGVANLPRGAAVEVDAIFVVTRA